MGQIIFRCGNCRQVMRVDPDKAGLQARCPRCAMQFVIPSASSVPPEPRPAVVLYPARNEPPPARPEARDEDYRDADGRYLERPKRRRHRDEEDRFREDDRRRRDTGEDDSEDDRPRKRRGSRRSNWPLVRAGVLVVAIATCVLAGGHALQLIGHVLFTIGFNPGGIKPGMVEAADTLVKIAVVLGFSAGIGAIVGYVFCLFASTRHAAMGLAIATLVLGVISTVLKLVFQLLPAFGSGPGSGMPPLGQLFLRVFLEAVFAAELILFVLFLRAVALCFKERGHSFRCGSLAFMAGGCAAGFMLHWLMQYIMVTARSEAMYWVWRIFHSAADLAFAGFLAAYIPAIFQTRDVID